MPCSFYRYGSGTDRGYKIRNHPNLRIVAGFTSIDPSAATPRAQCWDVEKLIDGEWVIIKAYRSLAPAKRYVSWHIEYATL